MLRDSFRLAMRTLAHLRSVVSMHIPATWTSGVSRSRSRMTNSASERGDPAGRLAFVDLRAAMPASDHDLEGGSHARLVHPEPILKNIGDRRPSNQISSDDAGYYSLGGPRKRPRPPSWATEGGAGDQ